MKPVYIIRTDPGYRFTGGEFGFGFHTVEGAVNFAHTIKGARGVVGEFRYDANPMGEWVPVASFKANS